MSKLQPPRGTQDVLPPLSERFREHERRTAEIFERAGYRPIITPMFEDTGLFARGVGESTDIVNKEMYTFTDRSGNSLTLRPEGTASVIRAVITHHLWEKGTPVKLWYSAAMFRYDRPQKARYRQHHQLGIEAVGTEEPAVDAEVLGIAKDMLDAAGVGETSLLLNSIGHPGEDCRDAYRPELMGFLQLHREELDADCRRRMETNPLRTFDCKNERDQQILADAPVLGDWICGACREHFDAVQGYLKEMGISFTIAPRLVRGFDYYTRTTFEYLTPMLEAAQNTVCGGGRYDGLSELLGGPPLPGIGFGSGIERVLLAQRTAGQGPEDWRLDCLVIPLEDEDRARAFQVVRELREAAVTADIASGMRSVKDHLARASRAGARTVAIIGPAERATDSITIRHMERREQILAQRGDVVSRLKELLG